MRVVVGTHGYCFDGAASAAVFTRLATGLRASSTFAYRSLGYGAGIDMAASRLLDGEENALLDFRFLPSARLAWYFDHHPSAFGSEGQRKAALARPRVFWDASYASCAKLVADVAEQRFHVDMSPLRELVRWAEIIDAARFDSADAATSLDERVLQLAGVIERHGDAAFLDRLVPRLVARAPEDVAGDADVQELWVPLRAGRAAFKARVERSGDVRGKVVFIDLTSEPVDGAAKFAAYASFPECAYAVTLLRTPKAFKLAVGYNPWSATPRAHDVGAICQRYDGGGHPVVGACTFPERFEARARAAAKAVTEELSG